MKSIAWAIIIAGLLIMAAIENSGEAEFTADQKCMRGAMMLVAVMGFIVSLPF